MKQLYICACITLHYIDYHVCITESFPFPPPPIPPHTGGTLSPRMLPSQGAALWYGTIMYLYLARKEGALRGPHNHNIY